MRRSIDFYRSWMTGALRARRIVLALAVLAAGPLGACQTTADDIAYPDLARTPPPPTSTATLSPEERDAAIEEMRAEARANAQRGL